MKNDTMKTADSDVNADFLNNIRCIDVMCKILLQVEPKNDIDGRFSVFHNMSELKQYIDALIPQDATPLKISHTDPRYVDFRYKQTVEGLPIIPNYEEILASLPKSVSITATYKIYITLIKPSRAGDGTLMTKRDAQSIINTIIPENAMRIFMKDTLPKYKEVRFIVREYRQNMNNNS